MSQERNLRESGKKLSLGGDHTIPREMDIASDPELRLGSRASASQEQPVSRIRIYLVTGIGQKQKKQPGAARSSQDQPGAA